MVKGHIHIRMDENMASAVEDEAVLKARALLYRRFKVSTLDRTFIILVHQLGLAAVLN